MSCAAALAVAAIVSVADDGLTIDTVGACPDGGEVRRLLAALVSPEQARATPVSVQDRGPRFRIAVGESATMLDDPGRDCAARAQLAATIAASDLQKPKVVFGPPAWVVEKGAVFDAASSSGTFVWTPGAEIRGAFGSGAWSLVGQAGARAPVDLPLPNGWQAEQLRLPVDAGARLTGHYGRFRPWLVLGGSLTANGIKGDELLQTQREWRLDLGALVMGGATLRVIGRFGLAAAINIRWQPRAYRLYVTPVGQVGETPAWWFGLSLDYTLDGKGTTPP
jgi:hypothetical protein